MSVTLAFKNPSMGSIHPAVQRQIKARSRFLSRSAKIYQIGKKVFLDGREGRVIGYNIADFGHRLGISHPIMVELLGGQVHACRLSDLSEDAVSSVHY